MPRIIRRRGQPRRIRRRPDPPQNFKFTRLVRAVIYKGLEARLPISRCVELAGISFVTYREWMKRGTDPDEPIYRAFRQKVKQLQADKEREALYIINKVAKGGYKVTETKVSLGPKGQEIQRKTSTKAPTWQAAAWFLERRYKEEYGRDPIDPLSKKTPAEYAAEIKQAHDDLWGSVPLEPDEEQDATDLQ